MEKYETSKEKKGGWSSAIYIIVVEAAERFAYYGVVGNLIMYLTTVLGQPIATAAKNVNIWAGVSAVLTIVGAFVADSYLGRFKTIVVATIIYLMGTVLLTISVSSLVPSSHRELVLFIALYVVAIGEGGHKPCVQTFAADQFNEENPKEKQAKSSFFNVWYLGVSSGVVFAMVGVVYVQDKISWMISYLLLTGAMAIAMVVFLLGIPTYRLKSPIGSPLKQFAQVFVAAARKWRLDGTAPGRKLCFEDGISPISGGVLQNQILARTNQFKFLEKAAIIDETDASSKTRNEWRLCLVNQVEEVKLVLRLFPIWCNFMVFCMTMSQQGTFYTKQGATMKRTIGSHFEIPPASLNVFSCAIILPTILIYDRIFVPFARRHTKHPSGISVLQRIGTGMFICVINMVAAAVIETKRLGVARENGATKTASSSVLPISIFWLSPLYLLQGVSDCFALVGMQELLYDQVPVQMRSMGAAAFVSASGVAFFMSSALISIVQGISGKLGEKWLGNNINTAHLDYFYGVMAAMSVLNFCVFVWVARGCEYKQVVLDEAGKEMDAKQSIEA